MIGRGYAHGYPAGFLSLAGGTMLGAIAFSGAGPHIKGPAAVTANPLLTETYVTDGVQVSSAKEQWKVDLAAPGYNAATKTWGWVDNLAAYQEIVAVVPRERYTGARGLIARVASNTAFFVGKSLDGSYGIGWQFNAGDATLAYNGLGRITINASTDQIYSSLANGSLSVLGNRSAGDAGSDVIAGSRQTRTAGKLLDVQNNGTNKAGIDFDGTIRTVVGMVALGSHYADAYNDLSSRMRLGAAGAAEAVLNATQAAGVISLQTNSVNRAQVDNNVAANETALLLSIAGAAVQRVSVGAADSGGVGFRVLRVAN